MMFNEQFLQEIYVKILRNIYLNYAHTHQIMTRNTFEYCCY